MLIPIAYPAHHRSEYAIGINMILLRSVTKTTEYRAFTRSSTESNFSRMDENLHASYYGLFD